MSVFFLRDGVQAAIIGVAGVLATGAIFFGAASLRDAHHAIAQNCENIQSLRSDLVDVLDRGEGRALAQSRSVEDTKGILAYFNASRSRVSDTPCVL